MKGKVNNETKAKFFAQYWGQKIVFDAILIGEDLDYVDDAINHIEDVFKHLQLLLKPLSSISDEDLLWCYHKNSELIAYDYTMDFKSFLEMANHWKSNEEDWERSVTKYTQIADYLRSKGYALPYFGLSVEEMIQAGWIKLTK